MSSSYKSDTVRSPSAQSPHAALRRDQLLRLLVESVEDYAILSLDMEGRVTSWNAGAERIKGYTEEEILGKHFSLFYTPEDVAAGKPEHALRVAAAEGRFESQRWRVRKDGTRFWANVVISPLRDEAGQLIGFAKVTRDLTQRMRAEERTRELVREQTAREAAEAARVRITAILDSISDGFFTIDREGRFLYMNRRAEEIMRRSRADLLGSSLWEELPSLVGPADLREWRRLARVGGLTEFDHFCAPLEAWLHVRIYPSDEGFSIHFHDITVQKSAEAALRKGERRLREVIDLLPTGVFLTDARGEIVWHNAAGREIWGGTRFVGVEGYGEYKAWWAGTDRRVLPGEWAAVRALKGETVAGEVIEIERFDDGTRRTILNSAFPLLDASGEVTAVVILNADVTEHQQIKAALHARQEVLRTVSHELRGAVHPILLQLSLMSLSLPEAVEVKARPRLETVERLAQLVTRLAEDLVEPTEGAPGTPTVRGGREEASSLLREAHEMLRTFAGSGRSRLELQVAERLPAVVADRQRILQVFRNLVENAAKYAPGGTITVRAVHSGAEVRFSVSDTGAGIPQEQLPRLFDPKWRASSEGEGEGLGLAIARGIVEAHRGRIWVESIPAEGTTFHFTLPIADRVAPGDEEDEGDAPRDAAPGNRRQPITESHQADERAREAKRQIRFLAAVNRWASREPATNATFPDFLHDRITTALHLGELLPGDRLPSIRALADATGESRHAIVQAYNDLRAARFVESRDRSGMYLAAEAESQEQHLGETGAWLAGVLTESWRHRIKIPHLSEVLQRYTAARQLRCACIDSDRDYLVELCTEFTQEFGIGSTPIHASSLPPWRPGSLVEVDALPREIREADLLVTSAFCAPQIRAAAEALKVPVVVVTLNPEHIEMIERNTRKKALVVVCTDPAFGERVREIGGGVYRDRIQVVLAEDATAVAKLDPSEPVLLTRAAHEQLQGADLRLLVPFSPALSLRCAQTLSRLLIRLNLERS